jgi:hypothetical protein
VRLLVLVSLAAMVDAIVGFGRSPILKRIGIKPCMGFMYGHSKAGPGALTCANPRAGSIVALTSQTASQVTRNARLANWHSLLAA